MDYSNDFGTDDAFNAAAGNGPRTKKRLSSALFAAAKAGDETTILKIVTNSPDAADWTSADDDGKNALMLEAEKGHFQCVLTLARYTSDIDAGSSKGSTALMLAAFNGHAQIVDYLVEDQIADVNLANHQGVTPLMAAAWSGNMKTVTILIDNDADIDAVDAQGMSPILYAAQNGHLDVVQALVDAGADLLHVSTDGMDLIAAAEASENPEMMVLAERLQREYSRVDQTKTAKSGAPTKKKQKASAKKTGDAEASPTKASRKAKTKSKEAAPATEADKPVEEMLDELKANAKKAIENINTPKPHPPPEEDRLSSLAERMKKANFF